MNPLCPSDISPKYDMKIFHGHFNLGGRIWGRKSVDPPRQDQRDLRQAGMSALKGEIDALVAPRQLYGLTEEDIKIVDGK